MVFFSNIDATMGSTKVAWQRVDSVCAAPWYERMRRGNRKEKVSEKERRKCFDQRIENDLDIMTQPTHTWKPDTTIRQNLAICILNHHQLHRPNPFNNSSLSLLDILEEPGLVQTRCKSVLPPRDDWISRLVTTGFKI